MKNGPGQESAGPKRCPRSGDCHLRDKPRGVGRCVCSKCREIFFKERLDMFHALDQRPLDGKPATASAAAVSKTYRENSI